MLTIKTLVPLVLFLCPVYSAIAQANFVAASIIQLNGDTLKGEIDDKEWIYNPKTIQFRTNKNQSSKTFKPKDIKGFTITSKNEKYQTAFVDVNNESLDGTSRNMSVYQSSEEINNSTIEWTRDTVFLSVLAQGRLNLFELAYYVDSKTHFFIQKGNGKIEELIYRKVKLQNHDTVGILKIETYKVQLHYLTIDYMPKPKTALMAYVRTSILNLVDDYNKAAGQSSYINTSQEKSMKQSVSIMAGMMQPTLQLSDYFNYKPTAFHGQIAPSFGVDYKIGYKKIGVGIELNFTRYKMDLLSTTPFTTRTIMINYKINALSTKISPYVFYSFRVNKHIDTYIKAGLSVNKFSIDNIERIQTDDTSPSPTPMTLTPMTFAKTQLNYLLALGVTYNNWFIEPQFDGRIDKIIDNENRAISSRLSVLVGYSFRFNKVKNK